MENFCWLLQKKNPILRSWVPLFSRLWQPKLGEIKNASNEDESSTLVHDRHATACKDKIGKTVGHVPKYVSKQMHIFIKYCGRVKMKANDKR